jgi:hypothetical protein
MLKSLARPTFVFAVLTVLASATSPSFAQTAPKPIPPKMATPSTGEEASSMDQKKACDAKWRTEKERSKSTGFKAYFTFMSRCM